MNQSSVLLSFHSFLIPKLASFPCISYSVLMSKFLAKRIPHQIHFGFGSIPSLQTYFPHVWIETREKLLLHSARDLKDFDLLLESNKPKDYLCLEPEEEEAQVEALKHFKQIYEGDNFYKIMLMGMQRDQDMGLLNQKMLHDLTAEASRLGWETDFRNP